MNRLDEQQRYDLFLSTAQSEPWVLPSLVVATTSLCVFDLYRLLTLLAA